MPTNYPQFLLSGVIANDGDYTIPPDSQEMSGDGHLSIKKGWDTETQTPIEQGGVAPYRKDFNGLAFLLSQFCLWYQQGGLMNYSSSLNYEVGNEVRHDGKKWKCVAANGPGTSARVQAPAAGSNYWKRADQSRYGGEIVAFCNVTLGGSDGRRPIFWGETEPDEGWVLCDGGSDGRGGSVPNLIGKSIEGSNPNQSGGTSGGVTVSTSGLPVGAILLMAGKLSDPNGEYVTAKSAQTLSINSYRDAYNSLGTTWGSASSGNFKTPSFSGRWLKMSGSENLGVNLDAGLPDVSGYFGTISYSDIGGCFKKGNNQGVRGKSGGIGNPVDFKLSYGNSIYGKSSTVQPRSSVIDAYIHVKASGSSGTAKTGVRYKLAYFVKLPD